MSTTNSRLSNPMSLNIDYKYPTPESTTEVYTHKHDSLFE